MLRSFLLLALIASSSCSHHAINNISYEKFNAYSTSRKVAGLPREIGPVSIEKTDYIFNSCESLAEDALTELIAEARSKGGNALMDVRWINQYDLRDQTPTCRVRWGWFFAYVIGGLGPWMKYVGVSAVVVDLPEHRERNSEQLKVFNLDSSMTDRENARAVLELSQPRLL